MKIKSNILKIVLASLLVIGFSACNDNKDSANKISTEKKVKLPKPEWDSRLSNVEPNTGMWYQQADDNEKAASNIGIIYSDRIKDNKKAIEWYLYSDSIKTNGDNFFNLAQTYKENKDYKISAKYYKKAFNMGSVKSANNLGLLNERKLRNFKESAFWYKKAIERENIDAIQNIALLYHEKLKDDIKASAYYIALIDLKYTKVEVLNLLKNKWKIPNETIKKGYELQLKMEGLPKRYTGELNLD